MGLERENVGLGETHKSVSPKKTAAGLDIRSRGAQWKRKKKKKKGGRALAGSNDDDNDDDDRRTGKRRKKLRAVEGR